MSADQYEPAPEQGYPSNAEYPSNVETPSAYSGNRPASGARRATPGEVLSSGFQGAENAGDFLGLDTEFAGSQGENFGGALDLVPPPGTYAPGEHEYTAPTPAPMPEGDAAQEFAQAPSAFEFGEDLGHEEGSSDDSSFAEAGATGRSKVPLLVGAVLLAALGGTGYVYGPGLYARFFGKSETVALQPGATPSKSGPTAKVETPAKGAAGKGSEIAALPSTGAGSDTTTTPSETTPDKPVVAQGTPSETRPGRTGAGRESGSLPPQKPELEATSVSTAGQDEVAVASTSPALASPTSFPNLGGAEYDWAASEQLELIWRGNEVPLEAVRAPAKTLMPKVGQVRIFTSAGDVFDGRLYAVGMNRVWVDAAPGRIGLDGDQVERIEVLPPAPAGQGNKGESAPLAGGKQVRARVPGGMLYGRILKSSGDEVLLALEDGGRVLVKSTDLEDMGSGRAIVVRR